MCVGLLLLSSRGLDPLRLWNPRCKISVNVLTSVYECESAGQNRIEQMNSLVVVFLSSTLTQSDAL